MAWYLRPVPPSAEAAEAFERERKYVLDQAASDLCGPLERECVSSDGRTLILIFADGTRREVTMPRANELPSFTGNKQR